MARRSNGGMVIANCMSVRYTNSCSYRAWRVVALPIKSTLYFYVIFLYLFNTAVSAILQIPRQQA